MKTIEIITSYSIHEEPTIKNRLTPIIDSLLNKNHKVYLISNDKKKFPRPYKNFIHLTTSLNYKSTNKFFLRLLYEFIVSLKLIKISNKINGNYVFLTVPSVFLLFFVFMIKNKKIHLDIRDLMWEYLFKNRLILKIIKFLIKKNFQYTNSISFTNEFEKRNLQQYGFDKKRMYQISNGISEYNFNSLKKIKVCKMKRPTVSYIGNIGTAQNLKILIDVANLMPQVNFNIVGKGIDLDYVKNYSKTKNLKNVKFTGFIHWDRLLKIYNQTDILFMQLKPNFETAVPSKLYEYFSTGKYIIYVSDNNLSNNFKKFNNYEIVKYGNKENIVKKISDHINSKNFRKISKKNRMHIKKYFIRENIIKDFIITIKND